MTFSRYPRRPYPEGLFDLGNGGPSSHSISRPLYLRNIKRESLLHSSLRGGGDKNKPSKTSVLGPKFACVGRNLIWISLMLAKDHTGVAWLRALRCE